MHATIYPENQSLTLVPENITEGVEVGAVTKSWIGLRVKEFDVDPKTGAVTLHFSEE